MAQEIPEQLFVGQVAQKALIEKDGKVLISLDTNVENWDLPGGRIHTGENPKEALAREVKEEIGVDIVVGDPFYTDFAGLNRFLVVYHTTLADPTQPFTLAADEIKEVRWISKDELESFSFWPAYKRTLEFFFKISDK
jgi:8-oxo-dGTP pyrophosphatase MutT (NUDIX family)